MNLENLITDKDINKTPNLKTPLTLTIDEVAKLLNISKGNAYILAHSKDFPAVTVGRRIIITRRLPASVARAVFGRIEISGRA